MIPAQKPDVTYPIFEGSPCRNCTRKEIIQPLMATSAPWYEKMKSAPRMVGRFDSRVLSDFHLLLADAVLTRSRDVTCSAGGGKMFSELPDSFS